MIERLYETFQPENYQLNIDISPDKTSFTGRVKIIGALTKAGTTLKLHAKELQIDSIKLNGFAAKTTETVNDDELVITSGKKLYAGDLSVSVNFSGQITDAMHGVYPCYFEHKSQEKKLIATQFESHHAREVFPCVDEPEAKATFDLTIVSSTGETVLANTPTKHQTVENGRLTNIFETTPKMSTYLLAFVLGEMQSKEATTKDGVTVRSWATVAQNADWLKYSLDEAVDYIEFYNDYFGTPYPLPKCDQVALPDFESAAMENWGLITYREVVLLSDPENPSLSSRQLISEVIAHELSHQWFGNLVTMKWWDDLWLNESFANMIACLAMDKIHPEWQIWNDYISQDGVAATNRDVYSDVQAVRVSVDNPAEIHTLFDPSIVYAKGGKLLKGLLDLLGEKTWRAGLSDYFKKHAYNNTTKDDLWASFSKYSELNIGELINPWLEQSGQPLVTIDQSGSKISLNQKCFLLDDNKDSSIWPVPLLSKDLPAVFDKTEAKLDLKADKFVQLNQSGFGHFITNYQNSEHKTWISTQLSNKDQLAAWKITRLNELVLLAKHGDTNLSEALEAIKDLGNEPQATVWSQIAGILASARVVIEKNDELEKMLKELTYQMVEKHYQQLGWEYNKNEDSNTTHLRTTVLALALASENKAVIDHALKFYHSQAKLDELPAEIRSLILGSAVKFGTNEDFEHLVNEYKTTKNAEYNEDLAAALTSSRNSKHTKKLLNLMLDTKVVRSQDTRRWFAHLMRNRYSRELAWQWLTDNWKWIMKVFGNSKSYDDFARYSAAFMNNSDDLVKYQQFFADKRDDVSLKRTVKIGTSEIKARADWRRRDKTAVEAWLKEHSPKS